MTNIEKQKTLNFIGNLADKNYSDANASLSDLVAEKLKSRIRAVAKDEPKIGNKAKRNK